MLNLHSHSHTHTHTHIQPPYSPNLSVTSFKSRHFSLPPFFFPKQPPPSPHISPHIFELLDRVSKSTLMAACKRAIRTALISGRYLAKSRVFSPPFCYRCFSDVQISKSKRAFLVDTLALVRSLEAQGVPSEQAEAITSAITEVLNDSLESISHSFVSKGEMLQATMLQESSISSFKAEVQTSQDHHFSLLQRENEKSQGDIEKLRNELKYEIDKVTAGQRLDLNLERGRIRDELNNQKTETTNLTNKLDREIHALRAGVEAAKYEVMKYCIGTLVSLSAVGLAILRILNK